MSVLAPLQLPKGADVAAGVIGVSGVMPSRSCAAAFRRGVQLAGGNPEIHQQAVGPFPLLDPGDLLEP